MDQAGIIRDLLIWLEGHLDQPLSLDNVAAKAARLFQVAPAKMFKDVTGTPWRPSAPVVYRNQQWRCV